MGIRGVTTGVNNAINVLIDSTGQLGTVSSSRRYKSMIRDITESKVSELRPVTFDYLGHSSEERGAKEYGLIAEEVMETYPELVVLDDEKGIPETVQYHKLPALVLKEIQDLRRMVAAR